MPCLVRTGPHLAPASTWGERVHSAIFFFSLLPRLGGVSGFCSARNSDKDTQFEGGESKSLLLLPQQRDVITGHKGIDRLIAITSSFIHTHITTPHTKIPSQVGNNRTYEGYTCQHQRMFIKPKVSSKSTSEILNATIRCPRL